MTDSLKITLIYEGISEIQKMVISRELIKEEIIIVFDTLKEIDAWPGTIL